MQRSLIDHRAGEKRLAVLGQRDGHLLKPIGPPRVKVSLEADFVDFRPVMFFSRCMCVNHALSLQP